MKLTLAVQRISVKPEVNKTKKLTKSMQDKIYDATHAYLTSKIIPINVPSTVSNFRATAKKYAINKNGHLIRDGKIVVKANMQEEVFQHFHNHSGRIACWERIKKR